LASVGSDSVCASRMIHLPRLYAILDAATFPNVEDLCLQAEELVAGGVTVMQYRNKNDAAPQILDHARKLKLCIGGRANLILNDRADLCVLAGLDGVHLGQHDLSPGRGRSVIGDHLWLGVSTHNSGQLSEADTTSADYIAMGPVFATASKEKPDPVVGPEGVREARALTRKPLVAIGGITLANCRSVIDAGADSVAVISALAENPRKSAEEFFRILR
jgi:thiamine-phosphate pyrophosphorylase